MEHAMRYAQTHLELKYSEQELHYQMLLKCRGLLGVSASTQTESDYFRLATFCMAHGQDNAQSIMAAIDADAYPSAKDYPQELHQINAAYSPFDPLHIKFTDIKTYLTYRRDCPNLGDIPSYEPNAIGRALRGLSRLKLSDNKIEEQLKALMQPEAPRFWLEVCPWLSQEDCFEVDKFREKNKKSLQDKYDQDLHKFDSKGRPTEENQSAQKIISTVHSCLDFYHKQLQSINFEKNNYFPTKDDIIAFYDKLFKTNLENYKLDNQTRELRREAIKDLTKQGMVITRSDYCRCFTQKEISQGLNDFNLYPTYFKKENEALCQRFIADHLAAEENEAEIEDLKNLLRFFAKINNKEHFNELGAVLGVLLDEAKPDKRYHVSQLYKRLRWLFDHVKWDWSQHFPMEVLKLLIKFDANSFLNRDMDDLDSELPRYIHWFIEEIISPYLCIYSISD